MEEKEEEMYSYRPDVINADDLQGWVPFLKKHPKLTDWMLHFVWMDRVNEVHGNHYHMPGLPFSQALVDDEFHVSMRVDNEEVLDRFPEGAFITVSNHPFGGFDGVALIYLVGRHRPDFKVMVNMFLNRINAMQPSFIAVDPLQSDDPEKKMATMRGIRTAMKRIKDGHPVGFFPAGAVSKINSALRIRDRQWQPSILRLIRQMKVPVVPIYFHGHNSTIFNILGVIDWRLRTLRLPKEFFLMRDREMHISIGEPIMPAETADIPDLEAYGRLLREKTYELEKLK